MKSLAAVVAALLITVGAANAGEIVITPKASDSVLVLTIRGGMVGVVAKPEPVAKLEHLKDIGATNAGEFVIKPIYHLASNFSGGIAAVARQDWLSFFSDNWSFIDKTGAPASPPNGNAMIK